MSENIKIGKKAKEILKSFAKIEESIIVKSDYLYTKNNSLMGFYTLPENEIEIDGKMCLGNINEFLSIMNFINEDELNISMDGNDIILQDDSKRFTYPSSFEETMQQLNRRGIEMFEESEDVVCQFNLDETKIEDCIKYSNVLGAKSVYIIGEDSKLYIELVNDETGAKSRIKLDGESEDNFKYEINDKDSTAFYSLVFKGDYEVTIKKAQASGRDTLLIMIDNKDIDSDEAGSLVYFTAKAIR